MTDKTWDRLSGLLLGAAAGFFAGVLLAPSSGSDTRKTIKDRTQTSLGQFTEGVRDIRDSLTKKGQTLLNRGVTEIEIREPESEGSSGNEDQGA